jgi:hypothetical protein
MVFPDGETQMVPQKEFRRHRTVPRGRTETGYQDGDPDGQLGRYPLKEIPMVFRRRRRWCHRSRFDGDRDGAGDADYIS